MVLNDGPESTVWGGFGFAQWQIGRRSYVGGRFDIVQEPGKASIELHVADARLRLNRGGERLLAGSWYLTFMPSEFSHFRIAAERIVREAAAEWRAVARRRAVHILHWTSPAASFLINGLKVVPPAEATVHMACDAE
jgi:hypothetical protein